MDQRLVAWARAVKARRRVRGPVLWLFTDSRRLPDPLPAIARLPSGPRDPGLCGVVFRHDGAAGREALARDVAALCRRRGLALSVAGDWRLAARLGAGVHLRAGFGAPHRGRLRTASAHDGAQALRARRAHATVFLSPIFRTASHPGSPGLGTLRWHALARRAGGGVMALGGIDGASVRRLGRDGACGVGAIGALGGGDRSG